MACFADALADLLWQVDALADPAFSAGAEALGPQKLRVTRPVDVWFDGDRVYELRLPAKLADLERLELDPRGRFPDGFRGDNVWPR